MVVTIYQGVMKLFPPTWQRHRLTIASTIVLIIQCHMSGLIAGVHHYLKANLRLDASSLRRTLRSLKGKGHTSFAAANNRAI
jgi:hypothetical protein